PRALPRTGDGSTDIGLMQNNSVHLPALRDQGIDRLRLYDATINARVGAALLRRQIDQNGDTWRAVGAYHSRTPGLSERYA
ncbi:lytic transglycosylase domain-containing protein, partial [Burkholderia pseudomallei]